MQKYLILFYFTAIIFLFSACKEKKPYLVDVSGITYEADITRYEQKLFNLAEEDFKNAYLALLENHPELTELLIEGIWQFGSTEDESHAYLPRLQRDFIYNDYMREVFEDTQEKYPEIDHLAEELTNAFRHVLYYFPEAEIPELYTFISAFTYSTVTYENLLAISLDMYLGRDYRFYPSVGLPRYKSDRMDENYITTDAIKAYALSIWDEEEMTDNTLLSKMIHEGKILHFMDHMLPETHDSIKIQYSSERFNWAMDNKSRIWHHFVEEEVLFTREHQKIDRYMGSAPFTSAPGVPHESAPRLGEWVGWQLVRSFMKNNPQISLAELMEITDYEYILREARYRP